jgi:hypothetical protein
METRSLPQTGMGDRTRAISQLLTLPPGHPLALPMTDDRNGRAITKSCAFLYIYVCVFPLYRHGKAIIPAL